MVYYFTDFSAPGGGVFEGTGIEQNGGKGSESSQAVK